ncbi:MAG: phosphoribosylanthranilate isomerase [Gemmataceae bacterium]
MPVRVKICGVTHPDDLAAACDLGADAVGLNFHPPSPRYVTPERAAELLARLPPFVEAVGVFVSMPASQARAVIAGQERIHTVQVHGDISTADGAFIPAFAPRSADDLAAIDAFLARCRPLAVLVDGHAAGLHGGTGKAAPWELLAGWRPAVPLILAGGLTAENVAEAVRIVRPYAVDVAGGVESSPGRKCPDKMRRFLSAARAT